MSLSNFTILVAASTIGIALTGLVNKRITRRSALPVSRAVGSRWLSCRDRRIWWFAVPLLLFVAANAMVAANALALGIEHFPERTRAVSALTLRSARGEATSLMLDNFLDQVHLLR